MTASLSWWRRIGLAFSVFFRILFDERYALSIAGGSTGGSSVAGGEGSEPHRAAPSGPDPAPSRTEAPIKATPLPEPGSVVPAPLPSGDASALVLLSLLQAEGRFVDFIQQDVAGFPDSDIGAVARVVHAGCRKVLTSHLRIAAIRGEPEGQRVALEPGFDPNRIKLTGNVSGSGRLNGVLRHRGWQAIEVHLPTVVDRAGTLVLCPAEVEL